MILTVTDFGPQGPYLTQMKAVIAGLAPDTDVLDLFSEAPAFDARATAYLLAAYVDEFPAGTVFLCVVDPGVGGARDPLVLRAGERWFVGPDNGLMAIAARRAGDAAAWRIDLRPERLSASFHGRDLFAPVAARLARGEEPPGTPVAAERIVGADWPDDLAEVVYIDHYGNAMTGLRASTIAKGTILHVGGRRLGRARIFSDVPVGTAFWYENANGLVEISVNQGRAGEALGLRPGSPVAREWVESGRQKDGDFAGRRSSSRPSWPQSPIPSLSHRNDPAQNKDRFARPAARPARQDDGVRIGNAGSRRHPTGRFGSGGCADAPRDRKV